MADLIKIFRGIGSLLKKTKKPEPSKATGEGRQLITYAKENKNLSARELAKKDVQTPAVMERKVTDDLLMGERQQPLFGSSTYDWAMKMGPGKYTPDEWLNHFTSTRKVKMKVFGEPVTKTVREPKRFTYDKGSRFAGKEASISVEELFDTNLANFDEFGNLTGGLLDSARKFGLKLSAQDIGNAIKLNPVNRLVSTEYGTTMAPALVEKIYNRTYNVLKDISPKITEIPRLNQMDRNLRAIRNEINRGSVPSANKAYDDLTKDIIELKAKARAQPNPDQTFITKLNQLQGEADDMIKQLKSDVRPVKYKEETSYTLQGGDNYRETVFSLPEPIPGNSEPLRKFGHYSDIDNNIFHVRYDTRFTPDGKKALVIHEIQSDANQNIAKQLTAKEAFKGEKRINPFQKELEVEMLNNARGELIRDLDKAYKTGNSRLISSLSTQLADSSKKLNNLYTSAGRGSSKSDYFPLLEADAYGDYALKFLMNKAAKENVDYVAVMPFNKLHIRQGYKEGNERFYGYASGKGIKNRGEAIMPQLMKKSARFNDSKAGPIKIALSNPNKPYKDIKTRTDKRYPSNHPLSNQDKIDVWHEDAFEQQIQGTKFMDKNNPNLYFDAFAIEVKPTMKYTQKLYKREGGLVVDIFKRV
jgi:hypothetical protein